jgi:ubiquinone/menaquinone biosynthesis C-methylase UbiE
MSSCPRRKPPPALIVAGDPRSATSSIGAPAKLPVMSSAAEEARTRAEKTYNAAADFYDDPANSFWERFGSRTVDRLRLREGARVLDVCCGSGASALPAAALVGPTGLVLGIDLAERLLDRARDKARARGLGNVEFRVGDILALRIPDEPFDAVVCVFGIFFVPDMALALRLLWEHVRPGGKLAITTWGPRFLEPGTSAFWDSIQRERPDLYKGFNPWDRICDPQSLSALFIDAGIANPHVTAQSGYHSIAAPEDWWAAVLGSGYRGTVDQLDAASFERVRAANLEFIRSSGTTSVETNVIYAVAEKI